MLKKTLAVLLAILLICLASFLYFGQRGITLSFSEQQLEKQIEQFLPYEKRTAGVLKFTFDDADVSFDPARKRIGVGMQINISIDKFIKHDGFVRIWGAPSYRPDKHGFFLSDIVVDDLRIKGLDKTYADLSASAIGVALEKFYRDRPVYTLEADKRTQKIASMVLQDVVVSEDALKVTLGATKTNQK